MFSSKKFETPGTGGDQTGLTSRMKNGTTPTQARAVKDVDIQAGRQQRLDLPDRITPVQEQQRAPGLPHHHPLPGVFTESKTLFERRRHAVTVAYRIFRQS
ncbi:MAG TPA: hypothetical protein VIT91_02690 [Chthoniobacterales bacterium]